MGGSILQLAINTPIDSYLTGNLKGNPQENYFKAVYHKHTHFSLEVIKQELDNLTAANRSQTCTIGRSGTLLTNLYLKIKKNTFGFQEGDIYDFIDNIELLIGTLVIDTHHGDFSAILKTLRTPDSIANGLRNMLIENSGSLDNENGFIYYPLDFFFCRNPGQALPLVSLQKHEVKIDITYGNIPDNTQVEVWAEYAHLDTETVRYFALNPQEYLIEQTQKYVVSAEKNNVNLSFNYPVKELYWVNSGSSNSFGAGCQFAPLRNSGATTNNSVYTPSNNDDNIKIKLHLGGHDKTDFLEAKYYKIVQPYQHHSRIPAPTRKTIHFNTSATANAWDLTSQASILYVSHCYMRILSVDIAVQTPAASSATASLVHGSNLSTGLTVNQTVVSDMALGTANTLENYEATKSFVSIVPPGHVIGILGSSTLAAFEGAITIHYEELPTLIGGDKYNSANIYMYSFALYPENKRSSGYFNFSGIDTAYLKADENFGGANSFLKIFGVNYNILRIIGGMGGLAYTA